MDIDMSALRLLEREREIPLDLLIPTIEQALLVAYHKTTGAQEVARAQLDRRTGHVTIRATEVDDDGVARQALRLLQRTGVGRGDEQDGAGLWLRRIWRHPIRYSRSSV